MLIEKPNPAQGPVGRGLEAFGGFDAGGAVPAQELMDMGFSQARPAGEFPRGDPSSGQDSTKIDHANKHSSHALLAQGVESYFPDDAKGDNDGMTRWPQQQRLRDLVKQYQSDTGATQAKIAEELGTTVGTLRQWLYNKTRQPELETLQRLAGFFKVPVTDFIDNPGEKVIGHDLTNLSDQARFLLTMIVKDYAAEDLSDEDRRFLAEDYLRSRERLRTLRATASEPARGDRPGGRVPPQRRRK